MSEQPKFPVGSIAWHDLAVADAPRVRDFYKAVVGWSDSAVPMSGDVMKYDDYGMHDQSSGEMIAGVCHARGVNADLPPQWLMYVVVADVNASIAACERYGGKVIAGPRSLMGGTFCVVQDPAGAVVALWQTGK